MWGYFCKFAICLQRRYFLHMKKIIICAFLALVALSMRAGSSDKKSCPVVYVYGVVQSFSDSTCYMTALQQMDGEALTPVGLLQDRATQSAILANFVMQKYGQEMPFASIMFGKSKKKMEREFLRVRSLYMNRKGVRLYEIPSSEFRFEMIKYDYNN